MLSCERLFTSSGTDNSLYVPGNIVHLRYNNPFDSVLGGLYEYLLVYQRLFASSGTGEYLVILFTCDLVTQLIRSWGGTR